MLETFTFLGFVSRWLLAMFLVLATYNPSGFSYLHWIVDGSDGNWLVKIFLGFVLGIAYATFIFASLRSLGLIGMLVWGALFTSITWLLVDLGLFVPLSAGTVVTLALLIIACTMSIGVSWSYIRGRLSGQLDTNDVTLN